MVGYALPARITVGRTSMTNVRQADVEWVAMRLAIADRLARRILESGERDKIAAEVQRFGGHLTKVQKAAVVDWIDSVIDK
jgi:hypothetical protein